MTVRHPSSRLLLAASALALALAGCAGDASTGDAELPTADELGVPTDDDGTDDGSGLSAMCVPEEPDCEDMVVSGPSDSSCLAGDEDCLDESNGGGDVARPVPLTDEPSDAPRIERGTTSGATGRPIVAARLVDDTTLELTIEGGACDLAEDVLVDESDTEVRVLVLTGQDPDADACTAQVVQWSLEIALDAPLGDRALLDLGR